MPRKTTNFPLFSIAAATNENLTSENWELILGVCDKVSRGTAEKYVKLLRRKCWGAKPLLLLS